MNYEESDPEFEINIFNWKGEDTVEVDIECGKYSSMGSLTFRTVTEARNFIKRLQKAKVNKYDVNEDGSYK